MERKIGEIFEYNGEWYQCVEGNSCKNCTFDGRKCYLYYDGTDDQIGECCYDRRKDNKDVIFKKLEKVGEPYFNGQYGEVLQEYKYYIPPITPDLRIHIIKLGIVGIEIKQTKENMEEYRMYDAKEDIPEFDKVVDECLFGEDKLNLKPFDLEAAKAGKPVCTRGGRKVRIICFDGRNNTPIVALIERDNHEEVLQYYLDNGRCFRDVTSDYDLMMLSEKKEGWVNVYRDCDGANITKDDNIYSSKEAAMASAQIIDGNSYVATTKINWEE